MAWQLLMHQPLRYIAVDYGSPFHALVNHNNDMVSHNYEIKRQNDEIKSQNDDILSHIYEI